MDTTLKALNITYCKHPQKCFGWNSQRFKFQSSLHTLIYKLYFFMIYNCFLFTIYPSLSHVPSVIWTWDLRHDRYLNLLGHHTRFKCFVILGQIKHKQPSHLFHNSRCIVAMILWALILLLYISVLNKVFPNKDSNYLRKIMKYVKDYTVTC